MVGKTKATAADKRRMKTIKEHMPCIPCMLSLERLRLPTIQHVVSGFTREGHHRTYASCGWHHLGEKAIDLEGDEWSRQDMSGLLGPSLTFGKKIFAGHFGSEDVLIAVQDLLLESFASSPWLDYSIPYEVRREATDLWLKMKS